VKCHLKLHIDITLHYTRHQHIINLVISDILASLLGAHNLIIVTTRTSRIANRPGFPGTVPELACGVPCPGQGRFVPEFFTKFCNAIQYDTRCYFNVRSSRNKL